MKIFSEQNDFKSSGIKSVTVKLTKPKTVNKTVNGDKLLKLNSILNKAQISGSASRNWKPLEKIGTLHIAFSDGGSYNSNIYGAGGGREKIAFGFSLEAGPTESLIRIEDRSEKFWRLVSNQ